MNGSLVIMLLWRNSTRTSQLIPRMIKVQTALHAAVLKKDYDKAEKLIEAGSDPECADINGISPLYLAEDDQEILYKMQNKSHSLASKKNEQISQTERLAEGTDATKYKQCDQWKQCVYLSGDRNTRQSVFPVLRQILHKVNTLSSETMYRQHYEALASISTP